MGVRRGGGVGHSEAVAEDANIVCHVERAGTCLAKEHAQLVNVNFTAVVQINEVKQLAQFGVRDADVGRGCG